MGKSKKPATKKTRQKKIPPSVKKPEAGAPFNVWMDNYQIMQEFSVSSRTPGSVMIPDFRNALTNARIRLSLILTRKRSINAVCEISSKQALISASNTQ